MMLFVALRPVVQVRCLQTDELRPRSGNGRSRRRRAGLSSLWFPRPGAVELDPNRSRPPLFPLLMARTNRATPKKDWAPDFLAALFELVTVDAACKHVGIERSTVYRRRQRDEEFALAMHDVDEALTQRLEREAFRRAVDGVQSDVFYKGDVVGTETKFSDTLLIFLLKAKRPEKYRENVRVEHAGKVGVDVSSSSDEELRRLAAGILARRDDEE